MSNQQADVVVIGAGFAGSLTALLLDRIGLTPIVIERGAHPRFAIGESSTPLANLVLNDLAQRYDLPRLLPLCQYGSWKRTHPELACGPKRGFSYFHHQQGKPFEPRDDHANELLVAANPDQARADTQWYRADVDHFFVRELEASGIEYIDRCELTAIEPGPRWRLRGNRLGRTIDIDAAFVIDAGGGSGPVASALGIENDVSAMLTDSRALYAHFEGVLPWQTVYEDAGDRGGHAASAIADHPFPCDEAALHHVFDGGWMWVLRFDNGVTSAGVVLDRRHSRLKPPTAARYPMDQRGRPSNSPSPEDEWRGVLDAHPSIARQFAEAKPITAMRRTDRLQRRTSRIAGENWALLPHAACFVDPLHSSGIAHTIAGIERLIGILAKDVSQQDRTALLAGYERTIRLEVEFVDRCVHGCYATFGRFDAMTAYSMMYFIAATWSEHRRRAGEHGEGDAYLHAGDKTLRGLLDSMHTRACSLGLQSSDVQASERSNTDRVTEFASELAESVAPFNVAGLCDPAKQNMYDYQ